MKVYGGLRHLLVNLLFSQQRPVLGYAHEPKSYHQISEMMHGMRAIACVLEPTLLIESSGRTLPSP